MNETHFFILLGLGVVLTLLQLALLLRKPKFETPTDLNARLGLLERSSQVLKFSPPHSTVTLFARFRGLSTSVPRAQAVW